MVRASLLRECGRPARRVIAWHEADGGAPEQASRGHGYDAMADLVTERVEKTQGPISAHLLLGVPAGDGESGQQERGSDVAEDDQS